MSRPLLQLALDHSSLEDAQRDVMLLKDSVDIVEAGTILCLNEGLGAVKALREQCPNKIIVADWKVADAGETLAQQAFGAGANWMTIICAAPLATVEKGHTMAQRCGGESRSSCSVTGRWTTPATGIVLACGRRFIIVVVMHRPAGNSGAKPIWHA
ncbi:3-keto-L-gulonate-6-phosphate decarboxylase [Escherichia coli]|uniref:3-keto-L-gulonate-6-phosphate decarboxylase n=1 Tax=Escherichia coli TaxID=562 RepID=A0A447X601_ECOLX|nr:3-keto-L-gulonate-6-phosphate decarboxylase [Escherichia coli]